MNDNDQQPETPEVDTPEAPKQDEQAPTRGTKKAKAGVVVDRDGTVTFFVG
ncbi:hypothetical protein M2T37_27115 [Klebsiella pneumoniae]|uniref:hypothetical protein n=1 Tax=Klebsiella pneumoniae TaxID=573 RepID=UPI00200BD2EF|nr:hypothetical protein [Klebsiella pneumoniae]MCL0137958.1 hypothetical protein [Klebsiella pneumoniae]